MQEDPLVRLDRLQRQLAEAQAIVQAWPEPGPGTQGSSSPDKARINAGGHTSMLQVSGASEPVLPGPAPDIIAPSSGPIQYPALFSSNGNDHAASRAKEQSDGISQPVSSSRPPEIKVHLAPEVSSLERRDGNFWSNQRADVRTAHERRRDTLANAKERLAELQVRMTFGSCSVDD